ncbi:hypothetical protein G6L37_31970 [Agrobacterium rubi]|uniref:phosphoribosyltransferase-like protein n=1 Tax=Agrobacterium rubi TaxID=28099 RepID=UPI00157404EC|nr:hypothetical protein [Agrobacterium rubi]NTF10617.1 hypothetical protein [Agrobacterium rubi]NTF23011.1 hypothetical protein [Agrobacterium rubi]NTF29942.1 hypothetical protein [Agrobacterium rubi]
MMRQELAESLLAKVMNWDAVKFGEEYARLNRIAILKYDEYQQFSPGRKFIESLVLWLRQFKTTGEREIAYEWMMKRLVFISSIEMRQLVESSYHDFVRPRLLDRAAAKLNCRPHEVTRIGDSSEFKSSRRRSLFLGLSDGSRMDTFRRSAGLDNEQVWQAYEIGDFKAAGFLEDLRKSEQDEEARFESVFLIDDFTASGTSYFRIEAGQPKGKVFKAIDQIDQHEQLISPDCQFYLILYVATQRSLDYLREQLTPYFESIGRTPPIPIAIYTLSEETAADMGREFDDAFMALVLGDDYYRKRGMDSHELKGGTDDMKRGYAGCSLPIVLVHNTPNNSLYLLWANEPDSVRGLFPRITRHKDA